MGKEYIPLFLDFNETTVDLTDEECGRLIRAIIDYANGNDYQSRLIGAEKVAFRFMKGTVDRNQAISEARSKAGASKKDQNESNVNKHEQNGSNGATKKENKKEKENKKQEQKQERFAQFWTAYPRHEAKAVAQKAFDKIDPDDLLLQVMIMAVNRWKQTAQWQEAGGQYIPHPATWLNQRRWEDEPPKVQKPTNQPQEYEQRDYSGVQEEAIERMMAMKAKKEGQTA